MIFNHVWLKGVFKHRPLRLSGTVLGIAVTVALLASIGTFIATGTATMTGRAVADVPVDWQVQFSPGVDLHAVRGIIEQNVPYTALETVGYADIAGLTASNNGSIQTTGAGKVLGFNNTYMERFPTEVRGLIGNRQGVMIPQQTAANLHAKVGDTITVRRVGLPSFQVKVDAVVDLPNADSLFQDVGAAAGTTPQAPPDNVVILPMNLWHQFFDQQAAISPASVKYQFHVRIKHNLPADPGEAYTYVHRLANNLAVRLAGSGMLGDNLAARLIGVREDALYARVLFLFLGLPGVVLAMLLTLAVTASGEKHRNQEQALLRIRGASLTQIFRLEAMEAVLTGLGGIILGVFLTWITDNLVTPVGLPGNLSLTWTVSAAAIGFILAVVAVLYPTWAQTRHARVVEVRTTVKRAGKPLWQKIYLDIFLLLVAGIEFWRTASIGYQIVMAPEGVPSASVNYEVFVVPVCLWLGGVLLSLRLWEGFLEHGRKTLASLIKPVAGGLSGTVAGFLSRQRMLISSGVMLVALAVSFAVSTAVFNTTYNAQSHVDAELTNGADVTVRGSTAFAPGSKFDELKTLPGVVTAQPMIHRYAYVGNDLQDLYGIDPQHIAAATNMSNAFFSGGNASATLNALANQPDGILVSEETVKDFRLNPGDRLNFRLQTASDSRYHVVPFKFLGVVREFPTAPKDSFLVANAQYIARKTGINASEMVLLHTSADPAMVAERARTVVSTLPGAKVSDINSTQQNISSSLTAMDLHGLTRLELIFAILLVAGATGLILALGLAERRKTFAVLSALGANYKQLGSFLWCEGLFILGGGTLTGVILGFCMAGVLVKVLTGVFDPPPELLSIPWIYLGLLVAAAITSTAAAVLGTMQVTRRPVVEELRHI